MALSCVFCASDWESKHSPPEDITMRHYRAPQGNLSQVREGTSSQERGSSEQGRSSSPNSDEGRRDDYVGQMNADEARRHSEDGQRRISADNERRRSREERKWLDIGKAAAVDCMMPDVYIKPKPKSREQPPPLAPVPDCLRESLDA